MVRLLLLLPVCLLVHDQHIQPHEALRSESRAILVHDHDAVAKIIRDDPTSFLQMCLDRYGREVRGYSCLLCKRERVQGELRGREEVEVHFKEQPHSVCLHWRRGAILARKVLFVKGANDDALLALPAGLLSVVGVQTRKLDHSDSRNSGRYLISEFGIKLGTVRVLGGLLRAEDAGTLKTRYEGIFEVPELDQRRCFKLVRSVDPAEEDGVREAIFYFDVDTWLQTGSILYDANGELIAEYFFKNVQLNPRFPPGQFTRAGL